MTHEEVRNLFAYLQHTGVRPPFSSPEQAEGAVRAYHAVLGARSKRDVWAALQTWTTGPKGGYWPSAAELHARLPTPEPSPVELNVSEFSPAEVRWLEAHAAYARDGMSMSPSIRALDAALAEGASNPLARASELLAEASS